LTGDAPKATAGWYPLQDGLLGERYWDGENWTGDVRTSQERPNLGTTDGVPSQIPHKPKDRNYLPALIVGALLILVFVIIGASSGGGTVESQVIKSCQDTVKSTLKSPATANFQTATAKLKDKTWTINGTVDSQNSFGALVRSSYQCTMTESEKDISGQVDYVK
jgi:hypothetical protein